MKPILVIALIIGACVLGYVALSIMTTNATIEEGEETGGWEGILLTLISPSVGFSVWIWPIVFIAGGAIIVYAAYKMAKNKKVHKDQYWRK